MIRRDDLRRVRIRSQISGRRWEFLRPPAVDARAAPPPSGRDLARSFARNRRSGSRRCLPGKFPAATARARTRETLLPALSKAGRSGARTSCDALLRDFEARITRAAGRAERASESLLLAP